MEYWKKQFIIALKIVLGISVVTILLVVFIHNKLTWHLIKNQLFYNMYYGLPLSIINGLFFDAIDRIVPWQKAAKVRAIAGIVGSIIVTMLSVLLLNLILWVWIWGNEYSVLFAEESRLYYIIALIITVVVTLIFHVYHFFIEVNKQTKLNAELQKKHLKTQLSALRAHIDPHFLFNSFNVLSGLIEENKEEAQEFLAGLSKIYRHIIERRQEEKTEVGEEINFAKRYLHLQSMRFEGSIEVEVKVPEEERAREIPSLTLQLLLENAIKHNKFDLKRPLTIDIYTEDGFLIIRNKKRDRKLSNTTKMGLKNIKERYHLLTDNKVKIADEADFFIVYLPLL